MLFLTPHLIVSFFSPTFSSAPMSSLSPSSSSPAPIIVPYIRADRTTEADVQPLLDLIRQHNSRWNELVRDVTALIDEQDGAESDATYHRHWVAFCCHGHYEVKTDTAQRVSMSSQHRNQFKLFQGVHGFSVTLQATPAGMTGRTSETIGR